MRVTTVCGETRAYPPASILCSLQRDADALSESCPLGPVDSPLVKWQPNGYTLSAFGTQGTFQGPLRAGCSRSPGRVFLPRARTNRANRILGSDHQSERRGSGKSEPHSTICISKTTERHWDRVGRPCVLFDPGRGDANGSARERARSSSLQLP